MYLRACPFLFPSPSYFENIDRMSAADYVPDEQDILRSRVPTTGIIEFKFQIKDVTFRCARRGCEPIFWLKFYLNTCMSVSK
jgi:hypothetical protein